MKKLVKILSVILTGSMLFGIVACGFNPAENPSENPAETPAEKDPVEEEPEDDKPAKENPVEDETITKFTYFGYSDPIKMSIIFDADGSDGDVKFIQEGMTTWEGTIPASVTDYSSNFEITVTACIDYRVVDGKPENYMNTSKDYIEETCGSTKIPVTVNADGSLTLLLTGMRVTFEKNPAEENSFIYIEVFYFTFDIEEKTVTVTTPLYGETPVKTMTYEGDISTDGTITITYSTVSQNGSPFTYTKEGTISGDKITGDFGYCSELTLEK